MTLASHYWTVRDHVRHACRPYKPPPHAPWHTVVHDPDAGDVRIFGRLSRSPDGSKVLVIVHGLGGCADSVYSIVAAQKAFDAGFSVLRISLRGSEYCGEDYFHGGQIADLEAAVQSRELQDAEKIYMLGFSLGGHIVLRCAVECRDDRIAAAAAVCAPLHLGRACTVMDSPHCCLYRRNILACLKRMYEKVARRRSVPTPVARTKRVRFIREWDGLTVAPRYGFQDAEDYYAKASVGPLLGKLVKPVLLVHADSDPLIPRESVQPWAARASSYLHVHRVHRGGHVGFPSGLDLGFEGPLGLAGQVVGWLKRFR